MAKNVPKTVAVVEIGSNELRLKIGQASKGKQKILETLDYPLGLGRDSFTTGRISFEKADKVCEIIRNYLTVAREYGVSRLRVVATTAVREARNRDYVLDQIRLKTGVDVEVIDDLEENYAIYKCMLHTLPKDLKQSALMIYIGSGNVGISMVQKEKIPFVQKVKIGSLRLSELFEDIQDYSREFYVVMEEYLETFTDNLAAQIMEAPRHFIASGNEIALVAQLCRAESRHNAYYISKAAFQALYETIKAGSVESVMDTYGISMDKAELLLPSLCIFNNLWQFSQADAIVAPMVQLVDAMLFQLLDPEAYDETDKSFQKNIALSSRRLAEKFGTTTNHYCRVEKFALKIFDKLKKLHGLSSKEKAYLQSAAILHDIGKIINSRSHYRYSYEMIRGLDIVGLNLREIEMVAAISRYHSRLTPGRHDPVYNALAPGEQVLVSKLSAILRLADALDRSHIQKYDDIDVSMAEDRLVISITTDKNTELEQWSFGDKSQFFEEVFGLKANLKKKKVAQ